MVNNDFCTQCSNYDSIEHTFINCHESVSFYDLTLRWLNAIHNTKIDISRNQFVLNMFMDFNHPPKTQIRHFSCIPEKKIFITVKS